jgi:hypothetical protein
MAQGKIEGVVVDRDAAWVGGGIREERRVTCGRVDWPLRARWFHCHEGDVLRHRRPGENFPIGTRTRAVRVVKFGGAQRFFFTSGLGFTDARAPSAHA